MKVSFTTAIALIGLMIFISFLLSLPVMLLWNGCLVGAIDGVREIGWLQAWGLTILCSFLFKTSASTK